MKSNIKGVYYLKDRKLWLSLTPHKKVLYRGLDQKLAEKLRIDFDEEKKDIISKKAPVKVKYKFKNVQQPDHAADNSPLNYFENFYGR